MRKLKLPVKIVLCVLLALVLAAGAYLSYAPVASCRTAAEPYNIKTTFRITLDGFVVSDNVTVSDSNVIDTGFAYSDHNPVYLDFSLQ